jgi:hypothetical protein
MSLKPFLIFGCLLYFVCVGTQIIQTYSIVTNLDISTERTLFLLEEFTIDEHGDVCVGDAITINIDIKSVYFEKLEINMEIKDKADSSEYIIREIDIFLQPYENKQFTDIYYMKESGSHEISVDLVSGNQHIIESKKINVKSFKDDLYFAVSYFHFNVQFIAGDSQVEENILNNSIRPLIEFHYDNPEYKFSFEIQGYGIEIIAERYPETLKYMRKMINRGQMELIVTHYSDQFFLAYPLLDFEKSIEQSDLVLKEHQLRKSNVFGTQEWQWSPYLPELMKKHGYDIFIGRDRMFRHYTSLSDNYWHYEETNLFSTEWDNHKVYLALDRGARIQDLELTPENTMIYDWLHRGDGELVNTDGSDSDFEFNAGRQRHYEETLEEYKEDGYRSVTISELIYTAKEKGFDEKKLDPIPDSAQGSNVYVWMGEHRSDWEKDIEINTERYETRNMLLATEVLLNKLENAGVRVNDQQEELQVLWKDLIMAQVTDATGWEPRTIEVDYGDRLNRNVTKKCEEIYKHALKEAGLENERLLVDINKNDLIEEEEFYMLESKEVESPVNFALNLTGYTTECYQYSNELYLLSVTFNNDSVDEVGLRFNLTNNEVFYTPLGQKETMNLTDYRDNNTYLPLANGFIYIGNETSIIKVCMNRHMLCEVNPEDIVFKEESPTGEITYQFFIYKGEMKDGVKLAEQINVQPTILIENGEMVLEPQLYEKR